MRIATLLILFFIISESAAQRFSVESDIGYGFGFVKRAISDPIWIDFEDGTFQRMLLKDSYGAGINFNAVIYYHLTDNIHLGLGGNYFLGKEFTERKTTVKYIYQAEMYRIIPQIKFIFPQKKFDLFSEFGLILSLGSKIYKEAFPQGGTSNFYSKQIYHKGISFGLMTSLGFRFKLKEKLFFYSACKVFAQSYAPKKQEIIISTKNGEDQLETLEPSTRYTNFVKSYTSAEIDEDGPSIALKRYFPFSSIGLNIGLAYAF